jgi:hypothetical protein
MFVQNRGERMSGANPRRVGWGLWEVALITALALAFRLLHLEEVRHIDSYFHIMAAASLLTDATLSIGGEWPYDRAYLFTYLVAAFQSLFGGTTFVAGLPSILAGVVWVAALFIWVRSVAGRTAAWVAGLLFCFDLGSLALAHMVRFYTLHGLAFFIGAIGLYYLVTRRPPLGAAAATGLVVIGAFGLAYHLQVTTVIGAIALVVWLVIEISPRVSRYLLEHRSVALALIVPVFAVVGVAGFFFLQSDRAAGYWGVFQSAPGYRESAADNLRYYIHVMETTSLLLWALFPVAALIAIARYGRPAIFSIVLFAVPFLLHSLAASKAERFLSYAMPFFFAIWGFALAALLPQLKVVAREAVLNVARIRLPDQIVTFATWSLLGFVFAALAVSSRPIWWNVYTFIAHNERPSSMHFPHWDRAVSQLKPLIDSVDVVVTSAGAAPYYYVGRVHVIAAQVFSRYPEFSGSPTTGVPMISAPTSLDLLIRCHESGLVAIPGGHWGQPWGFTEEMIEVLQASAQPIELPEEWRIRAYTWSQDVDVGEDVDCPVLEAHRAPRL